jgi:hypothetical protein
MIHKMTRFGSIIRLDNNLDKTSKNSNLIVHLIFNNNLTPPILRKESLSVRET